ncbi:hypothetical protein [Microbispora sp. NPDC049125]|uniref:hypothetical protein n=1 Tax=Microbispora sp. NPDC049125 TaxID=3154929 RepID=UPI0034667377
MSTPAPPPLVVSVSDLARRLGLPLPLDEGDRWIVETVIRDAQADVESYLGRPITPATYTDTGLFPRWDGRWDVTHPPVREVISATPEELLGSETGRYTVVYTSGLDVAADPELEPVRRFIRAHAMHFPEMRALAQRLAPDAGRAVASVTVEGQSIAYEATEESAAGGVGQVGSLPDFTSIDRWRVKGRRVHQPPSLLHLESRHRYRQQWWA